MPKLKKIPLLILVFAFFLLLGCASNKSSGSFSQDPGPIQANLIGALEEGEDPNLVPEVKRNFLKGCVTGATDSIPNLVAIQETGLLSVCGCSYTKIVEYLIASSTAVAEPFVPEAEIESDAYQRFKKLDEDFQKGEGTFDMELLEIFQTCIRNSAPTISS